MKGFGYLMVTATAARLQFDFFDTTSGGKKRSTPFRSR
jgi:hypothetical protein